MIAFSGWTPLIFTGLFLLQALVVWVCLSAIFDAWHDAVGFVIIAFVALVPLNAFVWWRLAYAKSWHRWYAVYLSGILLYLYVSSTMTEPNGVPLVTGMAVVFGVSGIVNWLSLIGYSRWLKGEDFSPIHPS